MLVGIAHSVLGEVLIFNRLRGGYVVPTEGGSLLRERHVRILWASWHLVTIFGFVFAAVLVRIGWNPAFPQQTFLLSAIAAGMMAGGLLVLYATLGRHPGWIGLLAIAILLWFALPTPNG